MYLRKDMVKNIKVFGHVVEGKKKQEYDDRMQAVMSFTEDEIKAAFAAAQKSACKDDL